MKTIVAFILLFISFGAYAGFLADARPRPATSSAAPAAQQQLPFQPTPADGIQSCGMLAHDDLNTILGLRTNLIAAGRRISELQAEVESLKPKKEKAK